MKEDIKKQKQRKKPAEMKISGDLVGNLIFFLQYKGFSTKIEGQMEYRNVNFEYEQMVRAYCNRASAIRVQQHAARAAAKGVCKRQ